MFPTFISILDIQSWWEVPSIAHFCSLFRTAFNLLDFDIEDLEEALLTDGTEETSWLQELIVRLLSGCLPNNEISTFNYQMFLRRLFRQKCQEHDRYNPFNTDCDFTLLPLRTKVDILHALCDFRLDAEDVLDQLKNLEADSLRVEPLGYDKIDSAYWYFYGTRLYREDFEKKNNKKKAVWQVICFTEEDWFQLTKKFKSSNVKNERALYHTLSKNFLPELPRLFKEKERQARRRLLENQPSRTSDRGRKSDTETVENKDQQRDLQEEKPPKEEKVKECTPEGDASKVETRHEMASKKKTKSKQRKPSVSDSSDKESNTSKRKKSRTQEDTPPVIVKPTVGRQTNNSLSALDGQIVIQGAAPAPSHKKKLKTSQVFQQTDEDLEVGMHKILDFVKNNDDAWPFLDPVEEEYAPNYYSIIRRPMDLTKMEEKLDQGLYKNFDKFKSDFQLIVNNCRLYNGVENEYTEMVDNLVKVFEKATEKYLDQISSSDEEIAVENLNSNEEKNVKPIKGKKKPPDSPPRSRSKPALAAQSKKKERSISEESVKSLPDEEVEKPVKKSKKSERDVKKEVHNKHVEKEDKKKDRDIKKPQPKGESKERSPPRSIKEDAKKSKKEKQRSRDKKNKKKGRKRKRTPTPSSSRTPTPSPARSALSTPPPSSPEPLPEPREDSYAPADPPKPFSSTFPWEFSEEPPPSSPEHLPISFGGFKPNKHNKSLRDTIEKLKANTASYDSYDEQRDEVKENRGKVLGNKEKQQQQAKQSAIDALSLATEQTLKDINKWLDDTPKFADFSSASNSPSYLALDDFDLVTGTNKIEAKIPSTLPLPKKDSPAPAKKKQPSKLFGKRREVQRTIDRLQPGKSKGNLITNIAPAIPKTEDVFPIAKIKDTKNSLIVKTDGNAPKLSLGSVLDSFGKHKFAGEEKPGEERPKTPEKVIPKETPPPDEEAAPSGGPTPNLSAWFKAFGAPKPPQKKADSKEEEVAPPNETSPKSDQQVTRQRRISTGSSQSERSSFSQDLDSPRVGMEERGAYPAPYPSPLNNGASPPVNSPNRSPYPPFNGGQMRVGFYQDTVSSSKSSPADSPYYHVYAPNTTSYGSSYTGTSPYYTHATPTYSSTNPTPPYNMESGSSAYYDTSKIMNYTANSPASSQNSPAAQPQMSPHSPVVHLPQTSPSVHSPSVHSPSVHSHSSHSPAQSLHSPGMGVASPGVGVASPGVVVVNSPGVQHSPMALNSPATPQENDKEVPHIPPTVVQHQQPPPAFPVKKRVLLDNSERELTSQFAQLQEEITNRTLQQLQQEPISSPRQSQQQLVAQPSVKMPPQTSPQQPPHQMTASEHKQPLPEQIRSDMMPEVGVAKPSMGVPYPEVTTAATVQFNAGYGSREASYGFNVPASRSLPTAANHQQKFDMSKFTNMGYSGPEVNFSRALQQQYELNYARTTVQSAISQASQLLSSQPLSMSQPVASTVASLPGYQKSVATNQQQAHASYHQPGRGTVDSVAERLAAQVQQDVGGYNKQDTRNTYNSPSLELEQALGLSRGLSNMMAGLQSGSNPYYTDKSHMFNMGYGQQQQQAMQHHHQQQPQQQGIYRQMAVPDVQSHELKSGPQGGQVTQERKLRKKKAALAKADVTSMTAGNVPTAQVAPNPPHAFQSYAGLKATGPPPSAQLDSAIASLKTASSVPGSAFNFGISGSGLPEGYPNLLDDFRPPSNYFMGGANAAKPPGQSAFLNPVHQGRAGGYPPPLGGAFMDTSSQLYQHYLQAGVLNQGLLGAGGYPPGYHHALASMRQPYDTMTRPSWL
ncbi:bromodomain-containing protein 4-like isoform X1 [Euwallacea fornicatus]|uniref:bromodomain-containing protein 4-like isoform X1 n=2 Tax=Euwallacea fornicatus TaxID=995702 RepID=UPI00338DEC3A